MKLLKKSLSVALSLVLCLSMIAPALAYEVRDEAGLRDAASRDLDEGETVDVMQDFAVSGESVKIEKDVTINLNGYTITNNVENDRLFTVNTSDVSFEIDGTADGSAIVIGEENNNSFGFIKIGGSDISGIDVTLNGGTYSGDTNNGGFIKTFSGTDTDVTLDNVTMIATNEKVSPGKDDYIINNNRNSGISYGEITIKNSTITSDSYGLVVDANKVTVEGGKYSFKQDGFIIYGDAAFDDATVEAGKNAAQVGKGTGTFTNCTITNKILTSDQQQQYYTALAASNGGTVNVNGGTYTSEYDNGYALRVFNSGGIINVNSGEFVGKFQNDKTTNGNDSEINISEDALDLNLDGKRVIGKLSADVSSDNLTEDGTLPGGGTLSLSPTVGSTPVDATITVTDEAGNQIEVSEDGTVTLPDADATYTITITIGDKTTTRTVTTTKTETPAPVVPGGDVTIDDENVPMGETPEDASDETDDPNEVEIDDEDVPLASGPVTRAQFVDALWRYENQPSAAAPNFTDVDEGHEYASAIGWAQAIGLVSGTGDGEFQPDELITVSAARTILTRFAAWKGMTMPALTTLTGGDGEAVLNCGDVLAEFFGA